GYMLQEGLQYLYTHTFLAISPAIFIIITVINLNVLSDNIQLYLDPTRRKLPSFKKLEQMEEKRNE
ncbi:MAG TPA: ABC transporter permease, partial [Lachnospiraceae bacterium]|nr:ABC transporter permease [Lachnospiraceae bacterium]